MINQQSTGSPDIVEAILAVDPAAGAAWDPAGHQEYVDGALHLTAEQWDRVVRRSPSRPGENLARAVWGIPVRIAP